jgi:protein SCO1/2
MRVPAPVRSLRCRPGRLGAALLVLGLLWTAAAAPLHAQRSGQEKQALDGVGVDQKLGTDLPLDLTFQNEEGEPVRLGSYFQQGTPVVLTLNYHRCPQLCRVQLRKFATSLSELDWTPGGKFEVVTVDINPDEGPAVAREAKKRYGTVLDEPEAAAQGWHFLTGEADAISALADTVGFRYHRFEDRTQQFAHPAALIFLSGEGTVTRYFTTLDPASGALRTALVEASNGEIGSIGDKVFLSCAQFNPDSNSYSASAFKLMQYGSVLMVLVLGGVLFWFWRREKEQLDVAEEQGMDATLDAAIRERT